MILIGHRASGKTTFARRYPDSVDTDDLIEQEVGCSVRDYFLQAGELAFRALESRVIQSLMPAPVIAVGGGAVLDPLNVVHLRTLGRLIYLHCEPDILAARDPRFDLNTYQRRLPIYRAVAEEIREYGQ